MRERKERISIHLNPEYTLEIKEAFTITNPSGFVGVTNWYRPSGSSFGPAASLPLLPDTLFHIQGTGANNSTMRISPYPTADRPFSTSIEEYRSKIELGANNSLRPKITIQQETSPIGVADSVHQLGRDKFEIFSICGPTDSNGKYVSFFENSRGAINLGTVSINGFEGADKEYLVGPNTASLMASTVVIGASGNASRSGTLALREQAHSPSATDHFGKLYVKPYKPQASSAQTQALFFRDDAGNEFNLVQADSDHKADHVYGDQYGNTYAGWFSPRLRISSSSIRNNSYFGYGIDRIAGSDNVVLGYQASSGCTGNSNVVIGSEGFTNLLNSDNNVVIGSRNLFSALAQTESLSNSIIIGNSLFYNQEPPENYTLAIGVEGSPLVTGLLKGSNRDLTILSSDSEDTRFKLKKNYFDYNVGVTFNDDRHVVSFGSQDYISVRQSRSMLSMRFLNKNGSSQTLVDYDPSGVIEVTPTWSTPEFKRPTVSVSGDIRVLGDLRFADGTSISSTSSIRQDIPLANSGLRRSIVDNVYYWGLDFDNVPLAINQVATIKPSESYVITDLDSSNGLGKMSLTALGAYITSGSASFAENCNAMFTNPDNFSLVSTSLNSNSVFVGCDVAANATGWKHGVFIGTEAGKDSTTNNAGLTSDTACVYIGLQAGHSASNTDNSVFIGNSAGKNADSSIKSVFIGAGAGQNSTNANSIGIGSHALEGELSKAEGGQRNIEIVAGFDDSQRLMYTSGNLGNRLNIQNTIAGNTKTPSISIGKATLTPEAPLEVIRSTTDSNYSLGHTDPNIQKWINNDRTSARVNSSGHFIQTTRSTNHDTEPDSVVESWYGNHEGFMNDYIYAPTSFNSPTSGWMTTMSYEAGMGTDRKILVVNRDTQLNIHGHGAVGGAAYVVTMLVNGEHRPIYVSCSG